MAKVQADKKLLVEDAAEATGETVEKVAQETGAAPKETKLKFKRVAKLTDNQLKLKTGEPVYIKLTGDMHEGKAVPGDNKQPPILVEGIDLETGENCILVVPTVVESTLNESYPDGKYKGLSFEIVKLDKENPDKKYFPYRVTLIELED